MRARNAVLSTGFSILLAAAAYAALAATAGPIQYAKTVTASGPIDPRAVPLGDGYVSTTPRVGYVDSCRTQFGGIGGAQVAGPWIDQSAKTWNLAAKLAVAGAVQWPGATWKVNVKGAKRIVSGNDLPVVHATGVFPIASTDPASAYDRNPNSIAPHAFTWALPATPTAATRPSCTNVGPIGVLADGVFLYNSLDGEGRDAAAHEVLDSCWGHPDMSSSYHHHDVPSCIAAKAVGASTLVGFALDGFGIYVERGTHGALLTNTALDACHGRASMVLWNGKRQVVYHYDATLEYPYTVGCFHGTPISTRP